MSCDDCPECGGTGWTDGLCIWPGEHRWCCGGTGLREVRCSCTVREYTRAEWLAEQREALFLETDET